MTRSPWRRIAALAVFCLICSTGLTACQTQAGVAAFVGAKRISETRLRAVAGEGLKQKSIAQAVGGNIAGYRRLILGRLVKHEVIAAAAARLHVSASQGDIDTRVTRALKQAGGRPQLDLALAAPPLRLPPTELQPFLRDLVLLQKMGLKLTAGTTFTEAQLRAFYDSHGGARNGGTFEQLRSQVVDAMRAGVAQQQTEAYVVRAAGSLKLRINPRYGRFDRSKLFDQAESSLIVSVPDDLVRVGTGRVPPNPS